MLHKKIVFMLITCLVLSYASTGSAAMTLTQIGISPFYRPPLTSEADLRTLVKTRSVDLKTGFTKAGYADLYQSFSEQFPTATIETIKIKHGESMQWMLYKKKGKGPVVVAKDVTWGGGAPLDAFSFSIIKDQKRYEFVVPFGCGNVALKDVISMEVSAAPVVAPPPAEHSVSTVAKKREGGFLVDAGLAYTFDPASYAFARVGYELPLTDNLYLMGLVGGFGHFHGDRGESAFVADVILDYHWSRFSLGFGGGYWSGNGGKMDLIADLGYRLSEDTASMLSRTSLFLEARSAVDELGSMRDQARFGLGVRYRF